MERKWWTLLAVCLATFMLLLDVTIVNVALPSIQRDLSASLTSLQWVVDAYALTLAALLLTAGTLADRFGRRRLFMAGVTIFTVASLACGLAGSSTVLNLSRAAQGVGGAAMFATSLALIAQEFTGRERGTAIAAWGSTVGLGVAIGPLVGGALTEVLSWPWIFFVNLPIGLFTLALAGLRMAEYANPEAGRVDIAGLLTLSAGLFLGVFGLLRGNAEGWGSTLIVGSLLAAGVLLVLFVLVERRHPRPMLDLSLFRKLAFAGVSIATVAIGAGMFSMFLYLSLYLQDILGYSPLQAGLRFLPLSLLVFFVPAATRNLGARVPPRVMLGGGLLLVSAGLLLMHGLSVTSGWTSLLAGFIVAGVGIGLSNPAIGSTALAVVEPARSGMASGISNTCRMGGVAIGIAALGAIFESRITSALAGSLDHPPAGLGGAVAASGTRAVSSTTPPAEHAQLVEAARHAFIVGLNDILLVGAGILLVGAIVAFTLIRASDFAVQQVAPSGGEGLSQQQQQLLRRAYAAFNARDIDGALGLMHSDVDWPNGMEGGRVHGHAEVRAYWTRQFTMIDSHVEPVGFTEKGDGGIAVAVHQVVRDTAGNMLADQEVRHVYSIRDGLIVRMDIEES
jgi:EmrB/QacA subfamily drug resistance transporter